MEELISIIVPVYNVEKHLSCCIESIINQTYKNLEIILINDESTDSSGSICDYFATLDRRIKVIHKKNEGVAKARNIALKIANGKYIGFVDSDDYIEDNMIEVLYNNLKKYHTEISICGYRIINKDNVVIKISDPDEINTILSRKDTLDLIFQTNKINGFLWNKLFSKSIINNLTMREDLTLCEDLVFICEILKQINEICYTSRTLYNYRDNYDSATKNVKKLFFPNGKCKYSIAYKEIENLYSKENIIATIRLRHIKTILESYFLVIKSKYKDRNIEDYTFKFLKVHFKEYMFSSNVSLKLKIVYILFFIRTFISKNFYV